MLSRAKIASMSMERTEFTEEAFQNWQDLVNSRNEEVRNNIEWLPVFT